MSEDAPEIVFDGRLWEAEAEVAWVFLTLPPDDADDIRARTPRRPGFGSVRVRARIGGTEWRTSIFPDKKSGSYVLPVKRPVREREGLAPGDIASVELRIDAG
jgi:hypothetical protein